MLIGCYGDVHLTKNMRSLQYLWDTTATKSIISMYDTFDELEVESVVCLGDFFDTPRLEAKHMNLVLPILRHMNERTYPTYILLGNHEIDSDESNILDFLSTYDNIIPVTKLTEIERFLFIPYNVNPTEVEYKSNHIVFTHHDIYGSELAGGKTKAFFGIDPDIFSEAKLVMNGHVHLKSEVRSNVVNAGSILVSQQGELKLGEYPEYYTIDTLTGSLVRYENKNSMIYLTIDESETGKVVEKYDQMHCVLRVEYNDEIPDNYINTAHTSWRKKISSIEGKVESVVSTSSFDMKNYLTEYIKKDPEVSDDKKDDYIATALEVIG